LIRCDSKLVEVDRKRLVFEVQCFDGDTLIGEGTHERFVVDSEKFMGKLE
jgi:predicted thioesterase